MACSSSCVLTESREAPVLGSAEEDSHRNELRQRRRRHSSYHARRRSTEQANIQLLVDRFLGELGRRLDLLESYGHLRLDVGIEKAWQTLHVVHESCARVSDGMIDAGRRRTNVFLETLEERYNDVITRKETLEQKVQSGVAFMEAMLSEIEARGYAMKEYGNDFIGEGLERAKTVVDGGLEKARRATETMKETMNVAIEQALQTARERGLLTYEELPDPWRINPHILYGYRFHEGKLDCVRSMLRFSNEFFNIWSHGVGLIIVLAVALYFYPSTITFSLSTKADVFVAAVFFAAACKCLACSMMWHTMNSIASQNLLERFACVDYTGISLLVAASILTSEYTAFYCEPVSRWIYMLTTAVLGVGGVILPWQRRFNDPDMAWARVTFYVTLSATGFLPAVQLTMTRGPGWAFYFYAPIYKSVLVYLTGAFLYAAKIPERWFPGAFDYVGGSHNLWHLAVLGGILFHYVAMQEFFSDAFLRARTHCPTI